MNDNHNRLPKSLLVVELPGIGGRGRPGRRFIGSFRDDLRVRGLVLN